MKLNNNIEVKYHVELHALRELIDEFSILFEMVKYVSTKKNNKITFKQLSIIFKRFSVLNNDELKSYLKKLIDNNYIEKTEDSLIIKEKSLNYFLNLKQ